MPDLRATPAAPQTLDGLANLSASDADAAVARWDADCLARYRGLLDAEPITGSDALDRPILLNRPRRRAT